MIKFIYSPSYIVGNEKVFFIYVGVLALIVILTLVFIILELKGKKHGSK